MTTFISLLRGINVGGQKRISMQVLKDLYVDLGFSRVETYLQSGNVVFESQQQSVDELVRRIEAQVEKVCGFTVPIFIRTAQEMHQILLNNPFLHGRNELQRNLHVVFLYRSPSMAAWKESALPRETSDEFALGEQAIYLFCPHGYARTKLSNNFFERKFAMPVTTRNWNTVEAIFNMAAEK